MTPASAMTCTRVLASSANAAAIRALTSDVALNANSSSTRRSSSTDEQIDRLGGVSRPSLNGAGNPTWEELPALVHQQHQRHLGTEETSCQPRQPIEHLVRRRVQAGQLDDITTLCLPAPNSHLRTLPIARDRREGARAA